MPVRAGIQFAVRGCVWFLHDITTACFNSNQPDYGPTGAHANISSDGCPGLRYSA